MRPSTVFPLFAAFLIVALIASVFILPLGYTLTNICSACQGKGTAQCSSCGGSGKCWVCGGTGRNVLGWCAACDGTGICHDCDGDGLSACEECLGSGILAHWMYNSIGFTVIFSVINIFLFLGLLVFSYAISSFYLSFNQWVYDVENMGFWFNPSFMTWLLAKRPIRWLKWQSGFDSALAIYIGTVVFGFISLNHVTFESFALGILFGVLVTLLFAVLFYRSFASRAEKTTASPEI